MDALECMSARTCPPCWHFRAGRCGLLTLLREADPDAAPMLAPSQPSLPALVAGVFA